METLKGQFVELLRLSEQIKEKKQNIGELGSISKRGQSLTLVEEKELELLRSFEEKLQSLNSQIEDTIAILDSLVH